MKDYNSDFYDTTDDELSSAKYDPAEGKNPSDETNCVTAEDASAEDHFTAEDASAEQHYTAEDASAEPHYTAEDASAEQHFTGSTTGEQECAAASSSGEASYFNRLHEADSRQTSSEDSTYHYSYVRPESGSDSSSRHSSKKKKGSRHSRFGHFGRLIASALVFGLVAGAAFQGFNFVYYKINPSASSSGDAIKTTSTLTVSSDTISTTTDLSTMVENAMPSVVSITSIIEQQVQYGFWGSTTQESAGAGSGIIIGQNDSELLIVTNYHVIEDAKSLSVGFIDDSDASASVKGYDSDADLAVVSVPLDSLSADTRKAIKIATLGKSSELKVGEPAIAIGNALGYGQSVTAGYVSALEREVALTDKTMTLLQTDAAINPGNSGGALLNIKGEVIGINTVKYSDTTVEGMGYAIPIDTAAPIIEALMNKETIPESEQAYLGITGIDIDSTYSKQLNLPEGIYVQSVQEDSPADQGGIHAGDVITKFNGNTLSNMESLINKLGNLKAGDQITLSVSRMNNHGTYEEKELNITLGAKSDQK